MYNRYIPQPDGSYRRSRMVEPTPLRHEPPRPKPEPPAPCPTPQPIPEEKPKPTPCRNAPRFQKNNPRRPESKGNDGSIGTFLKRLLPKDFDTGDLLIVLLLLLMAGDSPDEQNNALLTLVLYLFM